MPKPLSPGDAAKVASLERRIEQAKARLSALYAARRAIVKKDVKPMVRSEQREEQVLALAQTGADLAAIAQKLGLKPITVRNYLEGAIRDVAHEELLKEGKATFALSCWGGKAWEVPICADLDQKEQEIRARFPAIRWRRQREQMEKHWEPWKKPVRYVFNDGSVRYLFPDGTEATTQDMVDAQLTAPTD